jgi:hypothetical protein
MYRELGIAIFFCACLNGTVRGQSLYDLLERDGFELVVKSTHYYCLMIGDSIGECEQVSRGVDH